MTRRAATTRQAALLFLAGLCACTAGQPFVPDYARLRLNALGTNEDGDVAAANIAQYSFADAGRTYGRPIEGARAAASLEYMAGAFYVSPRWQNISALTKEELLQGRAELRTAIGVRPGARSQQIVDGLTGAATALDNGDQAAAVAALDRSGAFIAPGAQEIETLSNLPYMREANIATQHAADELFQNDSEYRHF